MAVVMSVSPAQSSIAAMGAWPTAAVKPMSTVSPAVCSPARYRARLHPSLVFCAFLGRARHLLQWPVLREELVSPPHGSFADRTMLLLTRYLVNERDWAPSCPPSGLAWPAATTSNMPCFHSNFSWSASSTGQLWPSRTSSWQLKTTSNCAWLNAGPPPRSEVVLGMQEGAREERGFTDMFCCVRGERVRCNTGH